MTFSDCMYELNYGLTGGWGYDLRKVGQALGGASVGGSIWFALQSSAQLQWCLTHWGELGASLRVQDWQDSQDSSSQ